MGLFVDNDISKGIEERIFRETGIKSLVDIDKIIDAEIERDMKHALSKNPKSNMLSKYFQEDFDDEVIEHFDDTETYDDDDEIISDPLYMSNEEFIQSLDNGVIYDHNFLMDKLEVDREEGNIEGAFQDVVQLFGLEAAYKYNETGELPL